MMSTIQNTVHSAIAEAREGDVLGGKYRIESVLGHGGMGVVVAARHLQLDERVAIKFLLPAALEQPEAVTRFIREAKAAIRIKSEHVVRVSDVGRLDNGAPFMVMEFLEGTDLAQWLKRRGVLSVEQAVEFLLQALEAIAEAHAQGIVHRDLKPANLFCVRRSDGLLTIKVLDFGISKVRDLSVSGSELQMTAAAAMGSPLYMSPEQMRSARDVDARTDIWSLGVVMYELLTGVPPFRGESLSEVCVKVASFSPPPMRELRPELPLELRSVVLKCLEKSPDERYANVAELAQALLPFAPKRARASAERVVRIITTAGLADSVVCAPISSEKVSAVSHETTGAARCIMRPFAGLGNFGQLGVLLVVSVIVAISVFWTIRRGSTVQATAERAIPTSLVLSTAAATPVPLESTDAPSPRATPIVVSPTPDRGALEQNATPRLQGIHSTTPGDSNGPAVPRPKHPSSQRSGSSDLDIFSTPH